jgi:osmotically-inducible protein OsmY
MRADEDIKRDVENELKWDPVIDATNIGVSVKDGVVALTGFVSGYVQKYEAEDAVKRIAGVTGVANDIEVRLEVGDKRPDPDIARDAVAALKAQLPLFVEQIKVVVKGGWLTLEGNVEWNYARDTAEQAVRRIKGVQGVTNMIQLKPRVVPDEIKKKIEEAFKRSAEVDAGHITVEAHGGEVVLKGTVRSWAERQEAERAAWSAPGVTRVEDRIAVAP